MIRKVLCLAMTLLGPIAWVASAGNDLVLRTTLVPVGTQGTRLTFPSGWGRQVMNPDFGNDQFLKAGADEYLVLVEVPGFLSTEESFREQLTLASTDILSRLVNGVVTPLENQVTSSTLFVHQRVDGRFGTMELSYITGMVGIKNTRFLVMAWTTRKNFPSLLRNVKAILASLEWDTESPEYQARTKKEAVRTTGPSAAAVLRYPPALYKKGNSSSLLHLTAKDEYMEVELHSIETSWKQAASDLPGDVVASRLGDWSLVDFNGQEQYYRYVYAERVADEGFNRLSVYLTPNAPRGLELRVQGPYGFESLSVVAKTFLADLSLEVGDFQEAYPPHTQTSSADKGLRQEWTARSQREGSSNDQISTFFWGPDGAPWILTDQGVGPIEQGRLRYRVRWDHSEGYDSIAVAFDTLYLLKTGEPVVQLEGTEFSPQNWRADLLLAGRGKDALALVRSVGPTRVFAFDDRPSGLRHSLILHNRDGSETVVGTFPPIAAGSFDETGEQILLGVERDTFGEDGGLELVIPLVTGPRFLPGRWSSIETILPGDRGWLIKGARQGWPTGWWRMDREGLLGPIVRSENPDILGLKEGRLWFSVPKRDESPGAEWAAKNLFSIGLADATRLGTQEPAVSAASLNEAGRLAALEGGFPPLPSATAALALVGTIRQSLVKVEGSTFPTSPLFIDTILRGQRASADLRPEGFRALALLVVGALLDSGVEWVDSSQPSDSFQPTEWYSGSSFAQAYFPPAIVHSTLYDEEGWYNPVSAIREEPEGRRRLVGLSPVALERALLSVEDPALAGLVRDANKEPLVRWLMEPPHVKNEYVKKKILERLWNGNDLTGLRLVLQGLEKQAPTATARLYRFLLSWAEHHFSLDTAEDFHRVFGDKPESLIPDLKALLVESGREPVIFYFLGKAWEFSEFPYASYNAKQCYDALEDDYRVTPELASLAAKAAARFSAEETEEN